MNEENLKSVDPEIAAIIEDEKKRQQNVIELIASENIVSQAVLEAQGSVLTNKYAEGYAGRRYYGGCEIVDAAERLAIARACEIFQCEYANVQPHSGSQANQAVFLALLSPGDKFLGMSLNSGGHLTHGSRVNMSGKWFEPVEYEVDPQTGLIDYDAVERLAKQHKPKLIIAGGSAYPRIIDFQKFRQIADSIGAFLMVDMAHFAGLVAGGVHPNPLQYADVVTSTTHKTLRGPRGGIILSNNPDLYKKLNSAVFPGLQGGPLMHVIAAKAVAFAEVLLPEFKTYSAQIIKNAIVMGDVLIERGYNLFTNGTDTHLQLVDLRSKGVKGNMAEISLERAHLCCNKNAIPFDTEKPTITSGIRIGSPAGTTRGFKEAEFRQIAHWIADVLDALAIEQDLESAKLHIVEQKVRAQALELCDKFPIA